MSEQNVPVTQADRDAARAYLRQGVVTDSHPLVQLLARHRSLFAENANNHRTRAEPDLVEAARDVVTDAEEFGILDGLREDGELIETLAVRAEPIRRLRAALTRADV